MDSFPKKPCRFCGGTNHFPYACYHNPKVKARMKKGLTLNQKTKKAWLQTRETWIRKNPPPIAGKYWPCYLKLDPRCPGKIDETRMTLDHVVSRSRDPSRRHDLSNLKPACWYCNTLKGSMSIEALERQYERKIVIE